MTPFQELKEYKTLYVRSGNSNYEIRAKVVRKPKVDELALLLTKVFSKNGVQVETTKLGRLPLSVLKEINFIITDAIKFIENYAEPRHVNV